MELLITIIRFPIGVFGTLIIGAIGILFLPIECVLVIIYFPFAAVLMSRTELKSSWLGTFPNSITEAKYVIETIWE